MRGATEGDICRCRLYRRLEVRGGRLRTVAEPTPSGRVYRPDRGDPYGTCLRCGKIIVERAEARRIRREAERREAELLRRGRGEGIDSRGWGARTNGADGDGTSGVTAEEIIGMSVRHVAAGPDDDGRQRCALCGDVLAEAPAPDSTPVGGFFDPGSEVYEAPDGAMGVSMLIPAAACRL